MEMKAILTDSKSITFNPVEGKEYTKHKYTLRRYTDAEYIEDVINEAEEYEMDEKEYKSAYELLIDDKSILKVVHADYRTVNPCLGNIFPEFVKVVDEIETYGEIEGETHYFPYDTLMKDGKLTEEIITLVTDKPDVINTEHVTVHTIDTSEDELYCTTDNFKYDDNGSFLGYEKIDTKIYSIDFVVSYELPNFNLVEIFTKDVNGNLLKSTWSYTYSGDNNVELLNSVSNIIEKSSIDAFNKYFNKIQDVVNNINEYIRRTTNEMTKTTRSEFHDVLDSLLADFMNLSIEPSKEKLELNKKLNPEQTFEAQSLAREVRQKLTTEIENLSQSSDKLNMSVYVPNDLSKFNEDDLLYGKMVNPVTKEVFDVADLKYNQPKSDDKNNGTQIFNNGYILSTYNTVFLSKDGRVFVSSTHLVNRFADIIDFTSKDTILKLVEDLGLTILTGERYSRESVENIVLEKMTAENIIHQVFLEITSDKPVSRKMVKTLLGENYNLGSKEVLDYVNEVKNIISELKEIVDKAINK